MYCVCAAIAAALLSLKGLPPALKFARVLSSPLGMKISVEIDVGNSQHRAGQDRPRNSRLPCPDGLNRPALQQQRGGPIGSVLEIRDIPNAGDDDAVRHGRNSRLPVRPRRLLAILREAVVIGVLCRV